MRGLYAIADVQTLASRGVEPIAFAEAVLTVRPAALQLRAKKSSDEEVLSLLRALAPLCRTAGVPLVCNDRPDLARVAGCDLVHVGQGDAHVSEARRVAPGLGVGVSTHDLAQLDAALATRPAYVAFGPVFPTASKENPDPVVGIDRLATAHARAQQAGLPLVAIGGITRERAPSLVGRTDVIAVIGELVPQAVSSDGSRRPVSEVLGEVVDRARFLHALMSEGPTGCP
jgi:thiamine-phosphate pyrophosphorylase